MSRSVARSTAKRQRAKNRKGRSRARSRDATERRPQFLYFAYGSNLKMDAMKLRTPNGVPVAPARLPGWELTFRGVADIDRVKGATTFGALWLLSTRDMLALDRYEGHPWLYERKTVKVRANGLRGIPAITYVMRDDYPGIPSLSYYATIERGFSDWDLPLEALARAAARVEDRLRGEDRTFVKDGSKRVRGVSKSERKASRKRATAWERERRERGKFPGWRKTEKGWVRDDRGNRLDTKGMSPATRRLYDMDSRPDPYQQAYTGYHPAWEREETVKDDLWTPGEWTGHGFECDCGEWLEGDDWDEDGVLECPRCLEHYYFEDLAADALARVNVGRKL